jgi:hypothetical protein
MFFSSLYFITLIFSIIGLISFTLGCNRTIYPNGCPIYTYDKVTLISSSINEFACKLTCYKVTIFFDKCEPTILGTAGSLSQGELILKQFPNGTIYDAFLHKVQYGRCIINEIPIINNYGNNVNDTITTELLPFIGILCLCVAGTIISPITLYIIINNVIKYCKKNNSYL